MISYAREQAYIEGRKIFLLITPNTPQNDWGYRHTLKTLKQKTEQS